MWIQILRDGGQKEQLDTGRGEDKDRTRLARQAGMLLSRRRGSEMKRIGRSSISLL